MYVPREKSDIFEKNMLNFDGEKRKVLGRGERLQSTLMLAWGGLGALDLLAGFIQKRLMGKCVKAHSHCT